MITNKDHTPPGYEAAAPANITPTGDLQKRLVQAIADPGSFVKRGDNYSEPIPRWSARAAQLVFADEYERLASQLMDGIGDDVVDDYATAIDDVCHRLRARAAKLRGGDR